MNGRLEVGLGRVGCSGERLFNRGLDGCFDVGGGCRRWRLRAGDQQERDSEEKGYSHGFGCRFLGEMVARGV